MHHTMETWVLKNHARQRCKTEKTFNQNTEQKDCPEQTNPNFASITHDFQKFNIAPQF
jgi:hypothetical protein